MRDEISDAEVSMQSKEQENPREGVDEAYVDRRIFRSDTAMRPSYRKVSDAVVSMHS